MHLISIGFLDDFNCIFTQIHTLYFCDELTFCNLCNGSLWHRALFEQTCKLSMTNALGEHSGLVVECLTRDRGAADVRLIGVTVLCP